jgi:hypothetical protein
MPSDLLVRFFVLVFFIVSCSNVLAARSLCRCTMKHWNNCEHSSPVLYDLAEPRKLKLHVEVCLICSFSSCRRDTRNRNGVVSIVTRLRVGWSAVRIPPGTRDRAFLWKTSPAVEPTETGHDADHPPRLRRRGAIPLLPYISLWLREEHLDPFYP